MNHYETIAEALRYIRANAQQQPDLEAIAAHVCMSPFHFQRVFTEWAGVSPKKFLQYLTLRHAKATLAQAASLSEAADSSGLSGTSRLHDLFLHPVHTVFEPAPPAVEHRDVTPPGRLRRTFVALLARLHRWAESGHAGSAVCTWSALQGSVVPGPSEALFLPLGLADPRKAPRLAVWAALGAIVGGLIAYAIGALAFDSVGRPLVHLLGVSDERWRSFEGLFLRQGALIVLLSTVSPLSTKLVCIGGGAFGVPFLPFVGALALGRVARFAVLALIVRLAGDRLLARLQRKLGRPIARVR